MGEGDQALPGVGRGQRRVQARHPRPAGRPRAAHLKGVARHLRGAVAVVRLDAQPQRHPAPGADGAERGSRDRGQGGTRTALGPGVPRLPGRTRRPRRRGPPSPERTAAPRTWHRPCHRHRAPGRTRRRRRGRRTGRRRRGEGEWRVDPAYLERPFTGRAALLSPFDRLVHDRQRTAELFGYDYQLEMYKPAAKRRWGYFALPILYGDQLVGKLDATADRKAERAPGERRPSGRGVQQEHRHAVEAEIDDLAAWLNLRRS
ncbi:DNA glycosylase AlkZ-like family protein [Streptomyces sp. L7]